MLARIIGRTGLVPKSRGDDDPSLHGVVRRAISLGQTSEFSVFIALIMF